jgi:hypothetical protein
MRAARTVLGAVALAAAALLAPAAPGQDAAAKPEGPRLEIYGFAQTDIGYDFNQVDPDWFDVLRVTKLPRYENEFGEDGRTYFSVRQSRFGVKGLVPTKIGEITTIFEWELIGVGVDAGQTTIRLRHAWGEVGAVGVGQTWSPFMDPDAFPNTVEYWGPSGMPLFRNVQLRWMPMRGDDELFVAFERPGASADGGVYAHRVELEDVRIRTPLPDLPSHYRKTGPWGHVQIAGILRQIKWDDTNADQFDLSGSDTGWGLHASTNLKVGAGDLIRASVVYGEGVENYMNDAPIDFGIRNNFSDPRKPVVGEATRCSESSRSTSTPGRRSTTRRSAGPTSGWTTPTVSRRTPSTPATTESETSCTPRCPVCWPRRSSSGAVGRTSRTASAQTT